MATITASSTRCSSRACSAPAPRRARCRWRRAFRPPRCRTWSCSTTARPQTLQWVREHAEDLAAVLVEPVQSRHPSLQPFEFLRECADHRSRRHRLRLDEVVTGFRVHPGGIQALVGIRADLATYGKVVGGGLPIGILAGSAQLHGRARRRHVALSAMLPSRKWASPSSPAPSCAIRWSWPRRCAVLAAPEGRRSAAAGAARRTHGGAGRGAERSCSPPHGLPTQRRELLELVLLQHSQRASARAACSSIICVCAAFTSRTASPASSRPRTRTPTSRSIYEAFRDSLAELSAVGILGRPLTAQPAPCRAGQAAMPPPPRARSR